MHEFSIARSMLGIAERTAREHGGRRVETIRIRVGILRAVVPETLAFALEVLGRGTLAEGAAVQIEEVSARAACPACGGRFELDEFTLQCPRCGGLGLRVEGGEELRLESIDVRDGPDTPQAEGGG